MRAFLDGNEHNVAHAHYASQEGEDAYDPQCCLENVAPLVHLNVLVRTVPYPNRPFVVGRCTVAQVDGALVLLLEGLVGLFGGEALGGEADGAYFFAFAVNGFDGGEGGVELVVAPHAVRLGDAHNFIGEVADVDVLTYQCFGAGSSLEQVFGRAFGHYHHFTEPFYVGLVDEAAVAHFDLFHVLYGGEASFNGSAERLVLEAHGGGSADAGGYFVNVPVEQLSGGYGDVALVEAYAAARFKAVVRH